MFYDYDTSILLSSATENVHNEYQGMVESLQKAWQLVGNQLRDHGGSSRKPFLLILHNQI